MPESVTTLERDQTLAPPPALDHARTALFLDLDGTLAAIEARPRDVAPRAERTELLKTATRRLNGRLAVISYHSLEDRIAKRFIVRESRDCIEDPLPPVCTCGHRAQLRAVTKGVITAGPEEVRRNRRARSAKLRVAEKLA